MPANEFVPVAGWSDAEHGELFASPLDQVAIRRRDVGNEDGVIGS